MSSTEETYLSRAKWEEISRGKMMPLGYPFLNSLGLDPSTLMIIKTFLTIIALFLLYSIIKTGLQATMHFLNFVSSTIVLAIEILILCILVYPNKKLFSPIMGITRTILAAMFQYLEHRLRDRFGRVGRVFPRGEMEVPVHAEEGHEM